MYFPKGFDLELSIELGELIRQAYAQFDSYESETEWVVPRKYALLETLNYVWTPESSLGKRIRNFDTALQRLSRVTRKEPVHIPLGFIARRRNHTFLIVRGTQTSKEWVRNFEFDLAPSPVPESGKVHEGFLQIYSSVRDIVMRSLAAADEKAGLFVAGHSLGGALATLAALDVESTTGRRISALYTYGSPRVGDDAFVSAFNARFKQRSFRIVNTSDIVTSIPLPIPIAGIAGGYFSHVDSPVDLTVQRNDLKENHRMETYLSELSACRAARGFFGRMLAGMTGR